MGRIQNLTAGFIGAVALNFLHETLRKNSNNVPRINLLGEEAINKARVELGSSPITNRKELHNTTLQADIISNTLYYSLIGGKSSLIWPKAIFSGLCAGIGAIKLPEPLGLDPRPVAATKQLQALTVGYYLFGALVTGLVLKSFNKS